MKHNSKNRNSSRESTSWEKVSKWYDHYVGKFGSEYQREIIFPGVLKMLQPSKGEKILDLACGQGVFCRQLNRLGAEVTGVDISKALLQIAKKHSGNIPKIDYRWAEAGHLKGIPNYFFDASVCVLAVQNMNPLEPVIRELNRVMKPGARLVWVLNHPCFRIPRQSGWGFDDERRLQFRRIDQYMSPLKIPIQMHPGSDPDVVTWSYHRPLSDYIRALCSQGWVLTQLEEWISHKKSQPGARAHAENIARQEIPLFLALGARKIEAGFKSD